MTSPDQVADRITQVWFIGLCGYVLGGLLLLFGPVVIPLWGAVVPLGCSIATILFDKSDGIALVASVLIQAALARLILVAGSSPLPFWFPEGMRNPLVGVAFGFPIIVGSLVVARAWRRTKPIGR